MKAQFVKLPIFTSDGQFVARYSEKGLAELDFPRVGTPRCGVRTSQRDVPAKLKSRFVHGVELLAV
jgi:hypothetical protein